MIISGALAGLAGSLAITGNSPNSIQMQIIIAISLFVFFIFFILLLFFVTYPLFFCNSNPYLYI